MFANAAPWLAGATAAIRVSLDISSYLLLGLRRGADQVRHAGLVIDRRAPPAIRLGVLQDRAVELWPAGGTFTAGMQSASE
jgi:hypothetical protein